MTTWVEDTETLFKSTAPHSSLIVCPKTVDKEAIDRKLVGRYKEEAVLTRHLLSLLGIIDT